MENVEYTIANPVKRLLAYIIDSIFISIASIIVLFVIGQGSDLTAIVESSGDNIENLIENLVPIIQILTGIQLTLGVLYYGVYQAISNGATLGKKLLHIRIVSIMEVNSPYSMPFCDILSMQSPCNYAFSWVW